jgi:hypothetical protein
MTDLRSLLDIIRTTSNLTDAEFGELVRACELRSDNPGLPTSTDPVCGAHSEPHSTQMGAFLGQIEISKVLGISDACVRQWYRRGRLPAPSDYVGRRPVWSRKTVAVWCEGLAELASSSGPGSL